MTEAFPFLDKLNALPGIRAGWVERVPGLSISGDRDHAMKLLRPLHETSVLNFAPENFRLWRAEQVHGAKVAIVPGASEILANDGLPVVPGVDGLLTSAPNAVLAIYVADCGAIWLADRKTGVIGLLHSGKKGTEGDIFGTALRQMRENFGTDPRDVIAVLSPCIRRPHYEVDFAGEIARQAVRQGIGDFFDCGENTGADLKRFYSYRMEKGETGRMMALIVREPTP